LDLARPKHRICVEGHEKTSGRTQKVGAGSSRTSNYGNGTGVPKVRSYPRETAVLATQKITQRLKRGGSGGYPGEVKRNGVFFCKYGLQKTT